MRTAGDDLQPGLERDVVRAVGEPAGWISDRLPFDEWGDDALAFLEDDGGGSAGGFDDARRASGSGVPPVSPDSFDPAELGAEPEPPRALDTLLVTGDSLAMPLDVELARRLADAGGVEVERDPHVGTGISKTGLLDWGKLSTEQVAEREPDATVVFIGANEGFPMPGADGAELACCGPEWAAEYAYRARRMMNTYRQEGQARVYWLTLPLPRDRDLQEVARSVNAAIRVAAEPYRAQVRVLDMTELFTANGYRDAMEVAGRRQIVRDADGIHLNGDGAGPGRRCGAGGGAAGFRGLGELRVEVLDRVVALAAGDPRVIRGPDLVEAALAATCRAGRRGRIESGSARCGNSCHSP